MARTRLKVCCIESVEEARMAVAAGADALGLVSAMPSGPGVISEALIAEIAAGVPPPVATFLLTPLTDPDAIVAQWRRCRTSVIQLVAPLGSDARGLAPAQVLAAVRAQLPGVKLVPVVHVVDEGAIAEACVLAAAGADALLLDSGRPSAKVPELGGTGRAHDWRVSRRLVEAVAPVPVFLAGGLKPENVGAAIAAVRPFGVDVCSGVRSDGKLSEPKLHGLVCSVSAQDRGRTEGGGADAGEVLS
jgi:phosphoribosylanthranilate isomerase